MITFDPVVSSPSVLNVSNAQEIAARSRSNFSSSFLFLSREKRTAIRRVYAFFRVIDDIVDEETDQVRQTVLIDSWKRELANTYRGTTIVPLLKELKEAIDRFQIPQEFFLALIEGCEMDRTKKRYANFQELYQYCYRVASMVGLVCMKIFEHRTETSEKAAIDLGLALQLTNIMRDVGVDIKKDRLYLPLDELERFHVSFSDIQSGRMTDELMQLMDFQFSRTLEYYLKAEAEFKKDRDHRLLAARIMAEVYRKILFKMRRLRYPVFTQRVGLNLAEKTTLLFKALVSQYVF